MPTDDSNKVLLGILAALAFGSVGLKAVDGPPSNGSIDRHPGELISKLTTTLRKEGFSTSVQRLHIQSSIVYASRGRCRLSVRDARSGDGEATVYARQAAAIGPVRYLYRGRLYASAPELALRFARIGTELNGLLGRERRVSVPVALAESPGCNENDFGLGDLSVTA